MRFNQIRLLAALTAAALVTGFGCGKSEPPKSSGTEPKAKRIKPVAVTGPAPEGMKERATGATGEPGEAVRKRNKKNADGRGTVQEKKAANKEQRLKKQLQAAQKDAELAASQLPPPTEGPYTNVLLITIDTLRADHMSCYGAKRQTTPNIDAIANEGMAFDNAFSQRNSTWASLATMMTSLYPVQHGVRHNGLQMTNEPVTLAEALSAQGYVSTAVYTNAVTQNWEGFQFRHPIYEEPVDERATHAAVKWLKEFGGNRKFFMWLHYFAPHADYDPPKEFRKFENPAYKGPLGGKKINLTNAMLKRFEPSAEDLQNLNDLYDEEVLYVDNEVGKVVASLKELGIYDKTLIILTADHGEELYEHDAYIGHDASVYDHVLRVPYIWRLPNVVPAGKHDPTVVQLLTIAPTVMDVLALSIPSTYEGKSLLPMFKGEKVDLGPSIAEVRDQMLIIRTDQYKYVLNSLSVKLRKVNDGRMEQAGIAGMPGAQAGDVEAMPAGDTTGVDPSHLYMQTKEQELYDVKVDPSETKEISGEQAAVVDELKKQMKAFQDKYHWEFGNAVEERVQKEVSPEEKERLKALGYVM